MKPDNIPKFKTLILRKRLLGAVICLLAYLPCQADIVIRAAQTAFTEYAAWVATHPDDQGWVHYLEAQHPTKSDVQTLAALVESSQKAFLTGSLEEAKQKFRQISDLAYTNDWRKPEREAITYSMLRFYQLEKSPVRINYLKNAALFGYDSHFDSSIFPPPIRRAWQAEILAAKHHLIKISNLSDFKGFDLIKVDGRSYPLTDADFILIPPGEHRISLFGSQASYFSEKITGTQLQVMKIEPVIIVAGNCLAPVIKSELHLAVTAVFQDACVRNYNGEIWVPQSTSQKLAQLGKLDLQNSNFKNTQRDFHPENSAQETSSPHSHLALWLGIGAAVATGLALGYKNNQNLFNGRSGGTESITPIHRQGN